MRVWVDCTAAAHPLVLRPIVELLTARGHEVSVTTREYGQTIGILDRLGIPYEVFGGHGGAGTGAKARALASRSAALARWARPRHFDLALAHGSVDVAVVGSVLRIPSVQMQDYEWAGLQRKISWRVARRVLVPDAIPIERLERAGASPAKLFRYPGLKEDYYLADFEPDPAMLRRARDRARLDPRRGPAAARELGLPRRQPGLRRGDRASRRSRGDDRGRDPPHRPPGGRARRPRRTPRLSSPSARSTPRA